MQLPKYKKKKRIKLKVCQEPGCGREFWGHPIAKYCELHRDIKEEGRGQHRVQEHHLPPQLHGIHGPHLQVLSRRLQRNVHYPRVPETVHLPPFLRRTPQRFQARKLPAHHFQAEKRLKRRILQKNCRATLENRGGFFIFGLTIMVGVAQLVRVPDCDSGCCRFESGHPPLKKNLASKLAGFFF